jgi:signal transduction histidine kinase
MIVISDNGEGMTPDELARAEGSLRGGDDAGEGTGLGIRLARQLVEAHGGTLEMASEKGRGTVAAIALP